MNTRYLVLIIILLSFVIQAPTAQAACPAGCGTDDDGKCYPVSAGATTASCTSGSIGGTGSGGTTGGSIGQTGQSVTLINPLKGGASLESFLGNILDFVIRIGAIIVVLMLVYIGFTYVISSRKPGEIEKVHTMFLWTIVGALILLGAKAIQVAITETVKALSVGG